MNRCGCVKHIFGDDHQLGDHETSSCIAPRLAEALEALLERAAPMINQFGMGRREPREVTNAREALTAYRKAQSE